MSRLGKLLRGSLNSNTMQVNGGLIGILALALQSEELKTLIAANPQFGVYAMFATLIVNVLLRFKTKTAISER